MKNKFTHLREAFDVYNRDYKNQIEAKYNEVFKANTSISIDLLESAQEFQEKGLNMLQEAFYEDTKEYNNFDNCRFVNLEYLKKIVDLV